MDLSAEIKSLDPSVFPPPSCDEAYRFIWLRSFHPWVCINITKAGERISLTARSRPPGPADMLGVSTAARMRDFSNAELEVLRGDVARAIAEGSDGGLGIDGAIWVLEAADKHGLKRVQRWSPRDGALVTLGLNLMKAAGVEAEPLY